MAVAIPLQLVKDYVSSLSVDSEEYKNLPNDGKGTIYLGKIVKKNIPQAFKNNWFKTAERLKPTSNRNYVKEEKYETQLQTISKEWDKEIAIQLEIDTSEPVMFASELLSTGLDFDSVMKKIQKKFSMKQPKAIETINKSKEYNQLRYDSEIASIKADMYSKYNILLRKTFQKGDLKLALAILDKLCILTGANEPEKQLQMQQLIVTFDE